MLPLCAGRNDGEGAAPIPRATIRERRVALGQFRPSVAETLNALGLVHHHMANDPLTALRCHGEALRILRRNAYMRSLQFDAAVTLSDMGDAYWKMGSYEDASAAFRDALEAFAEAGKGEDHPRVMSTMHRLSRLERGSALQGR